MTMTIKMSLAVLLLVVLLAPTAMAAGGHSCICEAKELGFSINCDDGASMSAALQELKSGGCASDCSSDVCVKNWYIVQSHHDYCPEDKLPQDIEGE